MLSNVFSKISIVEGKCVVEVSSSNCKEYLSIYEVLGEEDGACEGYFKIFQEVWINCPVSPIISSSKESFDSGKWKMKETMLSSSLELEKKKKKKKEQK